MLATLAALAAQQRRAPLHHGVEHLARAAQLQRRHLLQQPLHRHLHLALTRYPLRPCQRTRITRCCRRRSRRAAGLHDRPLLEQLGLGLGLGLEHGIGRGHSLGHGRRGRRGLSVVGIACLGGTRLRGRRWLRETRELLRCGGGGWS